MDRDCLSRVDGRSCDGSFCVDETGARIQGEEDSDGVGVIGGGSSNPSCDPTLPLEKPVDLGDVAVVAEAEDGTHYVVGRGEGEYTVFRSEGTALIPLDVAGSGSGGGEVFLTVAAPEGQFTLWFAPEDTPTQAVLFGGEVERLPDPTTGQELTLHDEQVLEDFDVRAAVSPMVVEYHARSPEGHEVVVVRPDRYFEYENLRLFLAGPGDEPLVERRITEVLRAQDGGSTHLRFSADGADSDAFFPIEFDGEGFAPGEGTLTLGDEEYPLIRGEETLADLQGLDFECFGAPPNGWKETNQSAAAAEVPDSPDGGTSNVGGVAGAANSGTSDAGSSEVEPAPLGPLCDGSENVRLLVRSQGGYLQEWDLFFGGSVFLIDGGCHYWFNDRVGELRTGVLSDAEAEQYEEAVRWSQLTALDGIHAVTDCADGATTYIQTATTLSSCTCGCSEAPVELAEAIDGAYSMRPESYAERSVPIGDGSLRALAVVDFRRRDTDPVVDWPLPWDVEDIVFTSIGPSSGTTLTDAGDIQTLRTIRTEYYETWSPGTPYIGVQTATGDIYGLLLRDELRSPLAEQVAEMIEAANSQ